NLSFERMPVFSEKRKSKKNLWLTDNPINDVGKIAKLIVADRTKAGISVFDMAKMTKCNKKTLYKYYGSLCNEQAKRSMNFRRTQKQQRLKKLKSEITLEYRELISLRKYPTKRRIESGLQKPALFKE